MQNRIRDILPAGEAKDISKAWNDTEPANEMKTIPPGAYEAHIVAGKLFNSRLNNTPGYKITFEIAVGEYEGCRCWSDYWLTPAALPRAKRDLSKLGVSSIEQLEKPLPRFLRCRVQLALRRGDDGNEYTKVKSFEVLCLDPPEDDPFVPVPPKSPQPKPVQPTAAAAEPRGRGAKALKACQAAAAASPQTSAKTGGR